MAHSDEELEAELRDAVRDTVLKDRDSLTINSVRKLVEEKLDLEQGFFLSDSWKQRSKLLIKEAVEAIDNETEVSRDSPKKPSKRSRNTAPKRIATPEDDGAVDESEEESEEEAPRRKRKKTAAAKPRRRADASDEESEAEVTPAKPKSRARSNGKSKPQIAESDEESELSEPDDELSDPKSSAAPESAEPSASPEQSPQTSKKSKQKKSTPKSASPAADDDPPAGDAEKGNDTDSSELSSLIDEPPKKAKRGKAKSKPDTASKPPAAKKGKVPETGDEAEVKKLQGQLAKCGIRKVWGVELKAHGTDTKAKIRHLREMLSEAGMSGRFSERKAKEIKERRELMSELEAVTTMNAAWGVGTGRPKRGTRKSAGEASGDEDEDGSAHEGADSDDGDDAVKSESDDGAVVSGRARGRNRALADLAFLGDDDDDSD